MNKRYALFVGRWQPFHNGHKNIIDQALAQGKRVMIGIRDTPITNSDPYTYEQRVEMIRRVYKNQVDVMRFPDIESINIGRNVGYDVNHIEAPPQVQEISATAIRSGNKQGNLPPEVDRYLKLMQTTVWFTGLPCSGKTTLAKAFKDRLTEDGYNVVIIDGDDLRIGLCAGLGFTDYDREENLRRAAHVCELFNKNRTVVLACFVSPTEEMRKMVRNVIANFKLIYVKCPIDICEKRDVKGMYAKARAGEIKDFTGVSAPYEEPLNTDSVIETAPLPYEESLSSDVAIYRCISELYGALFI